MIEVRHLSRSFGTVKAIEDVTFDVRKGEIVGFLGPNGAGKTTTMRILTGYIPATSGTARVAGFDVQEQSLEVRKRIGYMPENPPLYGDMTVESFLHFVAKIKGVEAKERKRRVEKVMEQVEIRDVRHRLIKTLSKGYKQRVGLAQALVHDPEVLILDEPTIGLDPKQIREVRTLIKNLAGEHTVILSTHILPEVSMTCERVIIINKGRIVAEDTPDNLTAKLAGSQRVVMEVEGPVDSVASALRSVPGVLSVNAERADGDSRGLFTVETSVGKDLRRELARVIVEKGWGLYELRAVEMSLEDVFLHLVTQEEEVGN
ncbi:MAG: ABC transporter ATP-binding protein [candidate division KSB1 bacterium]|nr:ABC transporter ATP-binding protein [candidate division KSB1 bacterium]